MFCVIYSFQVKDAQDEAFIKAWSELTHMIYQYEGSLGSRLHHEEGNHYIAYAQWPNKERWEKSGDHLPAEAAQVSARMRAACDDIKTIHKLELSEDLLRDTTWQG